MKHDSYEESCSICKANDVGVPGQAGVIWEDKHWFVRHMPAKGAPLAGWLMFHTQRHVQGPAHFTDEEAVAFGPVLRHISRKLEEVTGAPRVYLLAFGESFPHMHAHLIPRYSDLAPEYTAFGIADLSRAVMSGAEPGISEEDALAMAAKLREALEADPPPS
jgi:diadenosine tetraphosphate (Ap4A) HIT family hydrolase